MAVPSLGIYSTISHHAGGPGVRVDPYMGYNFLVEIGGILGGGFTQVSGLESSIELESYQEGGLNGYVHQFPGQVTYPNLVLSHGLTALDLLWDWYWLTTQGRPVLLSGTIMLLNNQRLPVMWWNVQDAYPVKWVGPSLDASSDNQVAIEQLELVHRGITKTLPSQGLAAAQGVSTIAAQAGATPPDVLL
jgi:phage tail-like protein